LKLRLVLRTFSILSLTSQNAFLKVSNDISQQLQKLNIKFVENSIPQKQIIDRIEDMKQDNASLISAVQTTHGESTILANVQRDDTFSIN
jgi:cephalosporin hydroxylase